ncbi:hypothetical protein [Prosthecobacter sp.]|uniref:hypothetical protein n=1 Tax=Prosthecobacter sp. TaxID=1965333 RepID=UPI003783F6F2
MNAPLCLLLLSLCALPLSAADRAGAPVDLSSSASQRPGTQLREKREVRVQEGKGRMQMSGSANEFSVRFVQGVNLLRRLLGSDSEEVQVREMVCELVNYNGTAPPAAEQPSPLVGKTLRLSKSGGKWKCTLVGGKPSSEQQKFLNDVAFTALLLEIPDVCLVNQTRKAGETWKISLNEAKGRQYGAAVAKDIDCTLVSVDERPDGPQATVHLTGSFTMERPMNFLSSVEISFDVTLVRRLSDMLNVDTKISGVCKNTSLVNDQNGKPAQLTLELPYTLTRTLAVERK